MEMEKIKDMTEAWYGKDLNKQPFFVQKDDDLLTTTTGAWASKYGPLAWAQVNAAANLFGRLPKISARQTGFKATTAFPSSSAAYGRAQDAAIPATVKPTYANLSFGAGAESYAAFSTSLKQLALAKEGFDDVLSPDALRTDMMDSFNKDLNLQINIQNGTLASAGNTMESIDRVCASYDEVTNSEENDGSTAYTASDLDPYGTSNNRDAAASWLDAYVSHGSKSVRAFSLSLIRTVKRQIEAYGGRPNLLYTGTDTMQQIDGFIEPKIRYAPADVNSSFTAADGKPSPGVSAEMEVAKLFGMEILTDADVVTDTGGVGRIYLLDTSPINGIPKLGITVHTPIQHLVSPSPIAGNALTQEEGYYFHGELYCFRFRHQGKVRDIST